MSEGWDPNVRRKNCYDTDLKCRVASGVMPLGHTE